MFTNKNIKTIVSIAILIFAFGLVANAQIHPNGCNPSGANASSLGYQTTASGINSFSNGYHAFAEGHTSSAIGYEVTASGDYSIALGRYLQVTQNQSFVIGAGISTNLPLINNVGGIMLGTGSQKPTMFISTAISNRTGSVGIGNITTPKAKLHIVSDDNEDAGIILQPTNPNKNTSFIQFVDNTNAISVKTNDKMDFKANRFRFGNANGMKITLQSGFKDGGTAIFSNAYCEGNIYKREDSGSSYAIEFKDDALRIRTAIDQMPRGTEITNWKDALFVTTDGKLGIGSKNTFIRNQDDQDFLLSSPKKTTLLSERIQLQANNAINMDAVVISNHAIDNLSLICDKAINAQGKNIGMEADQINLMGKVGINMENNSTDFDLIVRNGTRTANLSVDGQVVFEAMSGSSNKVLVVNTDGVVSADECSSFADNLGNHKATQNINLNGQKIVNGDSSANGIYVATNGNVRIGSGNGEPSKTLDVNGTIRSKEILVEVNNWSDFVFDSDYTLMSLHDVETYIRQHGHLPDVPSAQDVEKNGVSIGEMNAVLLQKIEEMTLHMIEMEKRIAELEKGGAQ